MTSAISRAAARPEAAAMADDEFELDLRFVELAAPLAIMRCDTSDGCGSTCSTTACNTSSNDPV
jgi:FxLD family lantipeptide